MSWYRTGTVSVTNGSKTVTGVGTLWTTAVNAGDAFALVDANLNPTGAWYEVESVTNNTTLVLKQSYAGSTGSNKQYCVFNLVGNMTTPSFAQRLATFFASFQSLIDKPTTTPTALGIPVADENGNIADGWIPETVARVDDMTEALALKIDTATATATPTASSIPIADENGDIDSGWLKDASATVKGVVKVGSNISVADGVITVPEATETVKGVVELATPAEVLAGTDTEKAVTPAGFKAALVSPSMTGSATLNGTTDNTVQLTDIVTTLGLEVGDVIRIQYSGYDKLHTVESITNNDLIIINYEHAGNQGNGSLKLTDTTASVTITRIAKWFNAPLGLGQAWVEQTTRRSVGVTYTNTTGRGIFVNVTQFGEGDMWARVDGTLAAHQDGISGATPQFSFLVPGGAEYLVTSTGSKGKWTELR